MTWAASSSGSPSPRRSSTSATPSATSASAAPRPRPSGPAWTLRVLASQAGPQLAGDGVLEVVHGGDEPTPVAYTRAVSTMRPPWRFRAEPPRPLEWVVDGWHCGFVQPYRATKVYCCPGCQQGDLPRTLHVVGRRGNPPSAATGTRRAGRRPPSSSGAARRGCLGDVEVGRPATGPGHRRRIGKGATSVRVAERFSAVPAALCSPTCCQATGNRDAVLVVGFAAFTGLAAQLAVKLPFTLVPITGQTFAVLLGAAALGWRRALAGMVLYLALGLTPWAPWFAEGNGGTDMVQAPSFGYVVGFLVAAVLVGWMAERGWDRTPARTVVTMVAATPATWPPSGCPG